MFEAVERITVENGEGKKFSEGDSVIIVVGKVNTIQGKIKNIYIEQNIMELEIDFSSDTSCLELSCDDITEMNYIQGENELQ